MPVGYFNPRAPCGARRQFLQEFIAPGEFQSTRPLRGATAKTSAKSCGYLDFNPRAPCGARPCHLAPVLSIRHFNPRAPCGARRGADKRGDADSNFNPRAPCGARLQTCGHRAACALISIHAPLAGRDLHRLLDCLGHTYFNPRAPCGARHTRFKWGAFSFNFNPRAPCGARLLHNPRCAS